MIRNIPSPPWDRLWNVWNVEAWEEQATAKSIEERTEEWIDWAITTWA